MYEQGFRVDPRDYYPGVNTVTLRLRRGSSEDSESTGDPLAAAFGFQSIGACPQDDRNDTGRKQQSLNLPALVGLGIMPAHGLPAVLAMT